MFSCFGIIASGNVVGMEKFALTIQEAQRAGATVEKSGRGLGQRAVITFQDGKKANIRVGNTSEAEAILHTLKPQPLLSNTMTVFNQVDSPVIQTKSLNRVDVGINANPDLEKALVDVNRPNKSWSIKQLQDFIEKESDQLKIIHRDQPDEKTEVGINGNIVWNNELSSFDDYLLCAQRLYDALGFMAK